MLTNGLVQRQLACCIDVGVIGPVTAAAAFRCDQGIEWVEHLLLDRIALAQQWRVGVEEQAANVAFVGLRQLIPQHEGFAGHHHMQVGDAQMRCPAAPLAQVAEEVLLRLGQHDGGAGEVSELVVVAFKQKQLAVVTDQHVVADTAWLQPFAGHQKASSV